MSSVYPTSYAGSPASPRSTAITPLDTPARHFRQASSDNRFESLQYRKGSDFSIRRPSFSSFSQYGGTSMSRQGSHASAAPSDATYRPADMSRRGTALTIATQQSPYGGNRPSLRKRASAKDGNWAMMDPDEVFRRLHVAEVKKVESQLRTTADGKQAELRTMVSERYRDLLLSTTQIATIHDSSLKLSQTLNRVEALCSNPRQTSNSLKEAGAAGGQENDGILLMKSGKNDPPKVSMERKREAMQEQSGDAIMRQLPSAAAVKLLLDAPETLYRLLSTRSYLDAAFLWLLARTVKEYMLSPQQESLNEDYNNVYTPLVQKQWETLVPLRSQVVLKATSSMRDLKRNLRPGQEQDRIIFIQTLLAVMLLDSNTASDVLNIFLGQRGRALEDIFTASQLIRPNVSFVGNASSVEKEEAITPTTRTKARHTRQASRLDAAQILRELSPAPPGAKGALVQPAENVKVDKRNIKRKIVRDRISKALLDTVKCIASTVGMAKSTYLAARDTTSGESLFEDAVHRVQEGERMASTAHRQQALRSAFVSNRSEKALEPPSTSLNGSATSSPPYISTSSMLRALPSSQMLLTYLPDNVQMFTPFISSDAKSGDEKRQQITNKLDTWVSQTLQALAPRIDIWLNRLDSIADIWKIRSQLLRLLDEILPNESIALSAEQVDQIRKVAQIAFESRTKALWRILLEELVKTTTSGLQDSLERIKSHDDSSITDLHPSLMFFSSPIHFPSASMGAFMPNSDMQANFVNTELPTFCADIRIRLSHRTHLLHERLKALESTVTRLQADVSVLNRHKQGHDLAQIYKSELKSTIRNIVQLLYDTLRDLAENTSRDPISVDQSMFIGRFALHMHDLEALSTRSGPTDLMDDETRQLLREVYAQSTSAWKERTLEDALQIFRQSFEAIESSEDFEVAPSVFNALTDIAAAILDSGIIQPYNVDLQKDIAIEFANRAIRALEQTDSMRKRGERVKDIALLSYIAGTATTEQIELALAYIKKVQLLLQPVLQHKIPGLSAISRSGKATSESRQAILLPFGQAPLSHDYVSPTPVMKPSARFAMLSIL
ncbi:hypothetical protein QFC21_002917 [Naganishia friedmannii]|uniref:Uncharacterized protein n=1 Tax=Naganishia friedmannii TaxID=89922 RepID=A0ACC2VT47_9TREE|nr:hypothetical protein QFC21_002917 [Naganishia friedmannii]